MSDCPEQVEDTTVYHPKGWRRVLLWAASVLYRLWSFTVRVEMDEESRQNARYHEEPLVIIMWHNTLFMAPIFQRRFRNVRKIFGLISASRDGGGLAYFFSKVGIGSIRGSSSRFGREGFKNLVRAHRNGHDITVTPDGPRGPVYVMKPGAVLAARRAQSKVLLGGFSFTRYWRLKSWDRFYLPMPFSRVHARMDIVPFEDISAGQDGVDYLQNRLRRITGELRDSGRFDDDGATAPVPEKARSPSGG